MIKMSGKNEATGRGVIILGIEERNVVQLKRGMPIHVVGDDLGFKGEIVIHYEETMEKLEAVFRSAISERTRVSDSRGAKKN
jgi:hypothetical protein